MIDTLAWSNASISYTYDDARCLSGFKKDGCTGLPLSEWNITTRNATMQFIDNPGVGGILALTKIGNACVQTLSGVNTYSGDTTVKEGTLILSTTTAVSPNTHFRLFSNAGILQLTYSGDVVVRGLYINGVRMPTGRMPLVFSSASADRSIRSRSSSCDSTEFSSWIQPWMPMRCIL